MPRQLIIVTRAGASNSAEVVLIVCQARDDRQSRRAVINTAPSVVVVSQAFGNQQCSGAIVATLLRVEPLVLLLRHRLSLRAPLPLVAPEFLVDWATVFGGGTAHVFLRRRQRRRG